MSPFPPVSCSASQSPAGELGPLRIRIGTLETGPPAQLSQRKGNLTGKWRKVVTIFRFSKKRHFSPIFGSLVRDELVTVRSRKHPQNESELFLRHFGSLSFVFVACCVYAVFRLFALVAFQKCQFTTVNGWLNWGHFTSFAGSFWVRACSDLCNSLGGTATAPSVLAWFSRVGEWKISSQVLTLPSTEDSAQLSLFSGVFPNVEEPRSYVFAFWRCRGVYRLKKCPKVPNCRW